MLLYLMCVYGFPCPSVFQMDVNTLGMYNVVLRGKEGMLGYLLLFIFYNKLSNFLVGYFIIYIIYLSNTYKFPC